MCVVSAPARASRKGRRHVRCAVAANQEAMADALARAGAHFDCPAGLVMEGWAEDLPVLAGWAAVGPSASALPPCLRRSWDSLSWPHATRGFFKMKSAIPSILAAEGLPTWS